MLIHISVVLIFRASVVCIMVPLFLYFFVKGELLSTIIVNHSFLFVKFYEEKRITFCYTADIIIYSIFMTTIDTILKNISESLTGVEYAFIGSVNLYIQGFAIAPRDIDILTTPEGIKEIDRLLAGYRTKDIYFDETEGRNSFRSFYMIDGVEVEVLGNVNNLYRAVDGLLYKRIIPFKDMGLPCISLEDELSAYKNMGRTEKAEMIEKFLKQRAL